MTKRPLPTKPALPTKRPLPTKRSELALLARTVVHLRPEQVAHRLRLRAQRAALSQWPSLGRALGRAGAHAGPGLAPPGWPTDYSPLDAAVGRAGAKDLAQGRFCLLGQERWLGDPADWVQAGASRLWRFHLHYFEWVWALAQSPERSWSREVFADLWRSWSDGVSLGSGDAWSPYVASLRAWALCGAYPALVKGTDIERGLVDSLHLHAGFLRAHIELDVGGNHLVKNLKALFGLGVFLGRPELTRLGCRHLARQLPVQVLADGGHFERSGSYHCQVLGDLLDVHRLLAAAGEAPVAGLDEAISAMRRWLGAMIAPDGEIPLLNDAVPVGSERLAALSPTLSSARLSVLGASGYVVVRPDERSWAVLDVGDPCPDDLPAHAHADCLSFELWVDGERVLVDTGTSTYEAGPRRDFERGTAAHNTVEVGGTDQTEVWGVFRAGRRARGKLALAVEGGDAVEVVASHDGYRQLAGAPVHRRRWALAPGRMDIEDTVSGAGRHQLVSRLYLAEAASGRCRVEGRGGELSEESASVAWGFGQLRPATVQVLRAEQVALPCTLGWRIRWVS